MAGVWRWVEGGLQSGGQQTIDDERQQLPRRRRPRELAQKTEETLPTPPHLGEERAVFRTVRILDGKAFTFCSMVRDELPGEGVLLGPMISAAF